MHFCGCGCTTRNDTWRTYQSIATVERQRYGIGKGTQQSTSGNRHENIERLELPPLSVFLDAVTENATVKRAQSQVEQVKNEYRLQKRDWWDYFRLNGNYAYGRYNVLNDNSTSFEDWYQSTTASSRHTFNVGASVSVSLSDLFNRPLRLKNTGMTSNSCNTAKRKWWKTAS